MMSLINSNQNVHTFFVHCPKAAAAGEAGREGEGDSGLSAVPGRLPLPLLPPLTLLSASHLLRGLLFPPSRPCRFDHFCCRSSYSVWI